jgi:hypothetical protein
MRHAAICFLGKSGSGKSTCADWLAKKHDARVFSFATPLKKIVKDGLGLRDKEARLGPGPYSSDHYIHGFAHTPRRYLEQFGEAFAKHLGKRVFVNALEDRILSDMECLFSNREYEQPPRRIYVIDDVRFPEEVKWIKNELSVYMDTYLIKLVKLGASEGGPESDKVADSDDYEKDLYDTIAAPESPRANKLLLRLEDVLDRITMPYLFPPLASKDSCLCNQGETDGNK